MADDDGALIAQTQTVSGASLCVPALREQTVSKAVTPPLERIIRIRRKEKSKSEAKAQKSKRGYEAGARRRGTGFFVVT